MDVLGASKPTKGKIDEKLQQKLRDKAFFDAINIPGDYSDASQFRRAAEANYLSDVPEQLLQMQQDAEYNKSLLDWAEKYAKTGA